MPVLSLPSPTSVRVSPCCFLLGTPPHLRKEMCDTQGIISITGGRGDRDGLPVPDRCPGPAGGDGGGDA